MKLIAETEYENQVIRGLTVLLEELGIDAESYTREEAVACTFWSADDFNMDLAAIYNATKQDRTGFLLSIEEKLRSAMVKAGYEVITHDLSQIRKSILEAKSGYMSYAKWQRGRRYVIWHSKQKKNMIKRGKSGSLRARK